MLAKTLTVSSLLGPAISASNFRVFDSTAYTNTSVGYGTSNINWIPNYVCSPLVAHNAIPSADTWQSVVLQWNIYPGYPLVLDCENIYLNSPSTADHNLEVMKTLQTWAAQVLPSRQIIGWYGLSGNTAASLYGHYQRLIANYSAHAFFPSAYTFSSSLATWQTSLNSVLAKVKAIDASLPVYPFIWPQYHESPHSFYPVELWKNQLDVLTENQEMDGFVIWGGKNHLVCGDVCQATAGTKPWLSATRTYLKGLYGIYGGTPQKQGAQLFTGV
ncbi:uncharacterized protein MAM_03888 [Metarhizium album ARSEF 1941]|uniref:Uncharacterized protein n=1 Tax=Metarhizium album (strain ARSEF 1941) TaxID=1081103 RepID=A0A0B2WXH4_METAS|nr:uncharacterized protein MAM_03888 [Metarhizium album ARSEF 1941]KHN98127.1 hypothetical protein MAM_03888 [Metarhizium album ARSEF 1941]